MEITIKCLDGLKIDPETCSIEELEAVVNRCKVEEDYWNTMQLSAKTFINSVYGVFGTNFFNLANVDLAESITLQGQDLIKFSVRKINGYFKEEWHKNIEGHKGVSDVMINEFGIKDFDSENFERLAKQPLDFQTLQVYGDSLVGNSQILTDNGIMTIKEMFDEAGDKGREVQYKIRVPSIRNVWAATKGTPSLRKIDYIMRHWTDKTIYRVTGSNGKFVDVTSDHSVMVVRDDKWMEVKPTDIRGSDKLITINENAPGLGYILCNVKNVEVSPYDGVEHFVYDICVDTDQEDEHTFFANGICVHNTDSISGDTIVKTSKHPDGIKISEFYEENSDNVGDVTKVGHESVNTDDKVLNVTNGSVYSAGVRRIIRHKVTKPKWKLTTSSGKVVYCTPDHSLVVVRGNEEIVIKPNEIQKGDKVITLK